MLFYGGIGLVVAGIIFLLAADKVVKDAEKAAQAKKQAPVLLGVGAVFLALSVVLAV
ncbi:MAG: hypothetical protein JY451_04990 [Erythrobacter sp.]|nr:MAG: hypothetical protein JY451_04990 [Erythrobacter sp.]